MAPKKTWREHPPPQTPLQRGAFLDACTAWLVAEPPACTDAHLTVPTECPPVPDAAVGCDDAVARAAAYERDARPWLCAACGARVAAADASPFVANPFSHQCTVTLCPACSA